MSELYDMIKTGLDEALAYENGACKATTRRLSIADITRFEPMEIRQIRLSTGMTQGLFASYMGVSPKTVEAWERGRNHPDGAASRLLWLTQKNPDFPRASGIVK